MTGDRPLSSAAMRRLRRRLESSDAAHPGVAASPAFLDWRRRIISSGAGRLTLAEGVMAEFDVYDGGQLVTFGGADGRRPVTLRPAADPDTNPLAHEHQEHFDIRLDDRHDLQSAVAVIHSITPVRVFTARGSWFVSVDTPVLSGGSEWHPRLFKSGPGWSLHCLTDGGLLDVLPMGPKARPTHLWVDSTAIDVAALGLTDEELSQLLEDDLPRTHPPAGRALISHLLAGGNYGWETVERYRSPEPWVPLPTGVCAVCHKEYPATRYFEQWSGELYREFCAPCLTRARYGDDRIGAMNLDRVNDLVANLARLLGRIPTSRWSATGIGEYGLQVQREIIQLAVQLPPPAWFTASFGSWTHALVSAGVLTDDTWRMSLGVRTIASDGHLCHSIGERTIDDWLHDRSVTHTREPGYPGSSLRADFKVGDVLVEHFGLAGRPAYDAKTAMKRRLAIAAGIKLVEVYPEDIEDWPRTRAWLAAELGIEET